MSVLIVGSVAIDHIRTPYKEEQNLLGGSAAYASVASSFFSPVNFVGIVGEDFPEKYRNLLASRSISLEGLQVEKGKTFRWSGAYYDDMNRRKSISTDFNVSHDFTPPALPESYRYTKYVLLANSTPTLQHWTLDQVKAPAFVVANTMDFWIRSARQALLSLLMRVDMLIVNESEAKELTGVTNLIRAGYIILALGPQFVVLNKGEHGTLLFSKNAFFSCSAYPLETICDPTGAGDTFAGGLIGYVASNNNYCCERKNPSEITFETLRLAVVYGTILASFNVESFSVSRLCSLTWLDIEKRYRLFHSFSKFGQSF